MNIVQDPPLRVIYSDTRNSSQTRFNGELAGSLCSWFRTKSWLPPMLFKSGMDPILPFLGHIVVVY